MKSKLLKYICLTLSISFVLQLFVSFNVFAESPYSNYFIVSDTTDQFSTVLPTPEAYKIKSVIDFPDTATGKLKDPQDMFIGPDEKIYIADSGNNRIVVLNKDLTFDFEITGFEEDNSKLNQPTSVFVDDDGTILVADFGNKRLIEFTKFGNFRFAYPTPTSDILGTDFEYQPVKVIKDDKGYIYVCSFADTNGILMLSSDGEFKNYYGTNKVALSLWESIARVLWDRESRKGKLVSLPYTFNNIFISDGYVYATTTGFSANQLRKINPGGTDVTYAGKDFSDPGIKSETSTAQNFIDVTVDDDQNMFIIDSVYGRIYEYDEWGRNLFVFGSVGEGKGQLSNPSSLEIDNEGNIYVLNKKNGTINVYETTEFADLVHAANENYSNGIYTKENADPENPGDNAFDQWSQVKQEDNFYRLALQSMGQVLWRQAKYDEAYDLFVEAEDPNWASLTFKEIRAEFLGEHFSLIATILVVTVIGLLILKSVMTKYKAKHPSDPNSKNIFAVIGRFFKRMANVSMHPIDGFEDIRYEGKGSYGDAIAIMLIYVATKCLSLLCTSFIFRGGQPLDWINWGKEILWCVLPWVVVCVVNYGVTSIMWGEGRLRDVIIGGAYCHVPFIFINLPLALITQVLTLDEQPLYQLVGYVTYAWVFFLVYFCIKGVHGYNPLKAVLVLLITAVGVAAVVILYMIVYGLATQVVEFVVQFAKELSYLV